MMKGISIWIHRFWQDLQPTPGRLNNALRITLATVIALILIMSLRMPFAALGLLFVFLVGRDSPLATFRSGSLALLAVVISVVTVVLVVILTDNSPMARVLSVSIVVFVTGILMLSTTVPALASSWATVYCTLIALWEIHGPADYPVKQSLYFAGTVSISIMCSISVEYLFGSKDPASELQTQRRIRLDALDRMFSLYALSDAGEQISLAVAEVSRLAAAGPNGMLQLYNTIVDRKLNPGVLPMGTHVRISMLAQLMDVSVAFGTQNLTLSDPQLRQRCRQIATFCHDLILDVRPVPGAFEEQRHLGSSTLLDQVDEALHAILSMPAAIAGTKDSELVVLTSSKVPLFIPGALIRKETVAFALKLSLCATVCYVIVRAINWPGISTSVYTVVIVGLTTTSAIKQKLVFRLVGATIGGLLLGIGATIYLFPQMDSITSLVLLIGAVAMLAGWWSGGRKFSYVGLQIAFSFYLVAFDGFSVPTGLAPGRDRLIGILLALVVMAFVFDQLWPVHTVPTMRVSLASMMRGTADYLRLANSDGDVGILRHRADALRDQLSKTLSNVRVMSETIEFEYGVDLTEHKLSGETIVGASFIMIAFFWSQFAVLNRDEDHDLLDQPELIAMRRKMANGLDQMAIAVVKRSQFSSISNELLIEPALFKHPRYTEFFMNAVDRFRELESVTSRLIELT